LELTSEFQTWVQKGIDAYDSGDFKVMTPEKLCEWMKEHKVGDN
jgi:hypothetical protein